MPSGLAEPLQQAPVFRLCHSMGRVLPKASRQAPSKPLSGFYELTLPAGQTSRMKTQVAAQDGREVHQEDNTSATLVAASEKLSEASQCAEKAGLCAGLVCLFGCLGLVACALG